jgi:hypothetical protein
MQQHHSVVKLPQRSHQAVGSAYLPLRCGSTSMRQPMRDSMLERGPVKSHSTPRATSSPARHLPVVALALAATERDAEMEMALGLLSIGSTEV